MIKKELENIRYLNSEIKACQMALERLELNTVTVSDKVKASNPVFPYQQISVSVSGDTSTLETRMEKAKQKRILMDTIDKRNATMTRLINDINQVEDPEIRTILIQRYVNGLTYEEIGQMMNLDRSNVCRKIKKILD